MSQAQDAMLGNLPNGIVATLANRYVTNVMNAHPETKLCYGQHAPLGSRPSRPATCSCHDTLATGLIIDEQSFISLCTCRFDE